MIPKIIHYVWFGNNELDEKSKKCIDSWRKFCPDYKIMCWNENNFDIARNQYCKEAYRQKKWAYVSDYARLWVLVNYGGVYMDTDVEVVRPLDDFLKHAAFSGFQRVDQIPTGIMACEKGFPLFEELLRDYDNRIFSFDEISPDEMTNVAAITKLCLEKGLILNGEYQVVDGFALYPTDWFCAKDTSTMRLSVSDNTHCIHHFAGSWLSSSDKLVRAKKQELLTKHSWMSSQAAGFFSRILCSFENGDIEPMAIGAKRLKSKIFAHIKYRY